MPHPLSRTQTLQNAAFLKALAQTGNIRAAARQIGVSPATLHGRRAAHPAFAQGWDAAIAIAHSQLAEAGGRKLAQRADNPAGHRTRGGEPVVVQRRDGKLQLRAAQPGKITRACEQAFLQALSATANVRLSAAAAGASVAAFYRRRRRNPGFAREMQLALEMGYERLEMALLESFEVEAHEHDDWRHNDPPPVPPMTANQALQLLYLHHKTARLTAEAPHMKPRRGETSEMWSMRRAADYRAAKTREAEAMKIAAAAAALAKAERAARREAKATLPALEQVTGWSKADPAKVPHDPTRALFGGWRLENMRE